ncbi:MAG: hypothetical protein HGA19_19620, partial [Oscillochloris sp.]|nr:hypothetical protein [Oscillochloris sp.]
YAATIEEMCASPTDTMAFIPAFGYVLANDLCGVDVAFKAVRYGYPVYWAKYIVATDLISGEEIVFDRGPVAEAVRASMSVIGVFEPAAIAGRFLIDGGSVNPVPTQLLADKGMSIIMISSELPEVLGMSDRVYIVSAGRVKGELPIAEATPEKVMQLATN